MEYARGGGFCIRRGAAEALTAAILVFCRRSKSGRAPPRMGEELVQIRHACDLLELEFSETAAAFAATDEYDVQGSVSPCDWIRHQCNLSASAASDRVCVGQKVNDLPLSVEGVEEGRIGFAHLVHISRTANAISQSPTGGEFDEARLLSAAEEFSVGRFWHVCMHARHAGDPEGVAADEVDAVERRQLHLRSCEDGMVLVKGVLDSAGGAVLRTALEPLARHYGADDRRLVDQRMADALVELAMHGLDTGAIPQRASQRTHLQVTSSIETLLGLLGSPAADMEFSLPISSRMVERLSCDCSLTRVLLGADSAVIDVGRAMRVVPPATRRALNVRDKCCRWPGCDRPASWTESHHLRHWIRGGRTDLPNLVLLCHRHHWMSHEGGWQLVRSDDGSLLTLPPQVYFDQFARGPDHTVAA